MLKEEEKEWMRDPQPWMHGFKSTGNREEDERLIEYKRLNWNHYVWRVAEDSKRTNDVRMHCPNSIVRLFCQQAKHMVDPEGKLIEWHEKNNERKRLEAEQKATEAAEEKKVKLEKQKANKAAYQRKYRAKKKAEREALKKQQEKEKAKQRMKNWKLNNGKLDYVESDSEDEEFLASFRFKSLSERRKEFDKLRRLAPQLAGLVAEKPPANLNCCIQALEAEEAEETDNSSHEEDEEYDSSGDDLPLNSLKEARQMDEIHAAITDNFESESDTDSDGTEEFEFSWCLDDV